MEDLNTSIVSAKEYENALNQVARYNKPPTGVSGKYQLKPESWQEFDPYFIRYIPSA